MAKCGTEVTGLQVKDRIRSDSIPHSASMIVSLTLLYNACRTVIPTKLLLDLIGERESRSKRLDSGSSQE
jgi:hypothetical protein